MEHYMNMNNNPRPQ